MHKLQCALFAIVTILAVSVECWSATYYVDKKNGSDSNPGISETFPWKTIQKATNTLIAGDTVLIKAGWYQERVIPQNSGREGKWITYTNYGDDVVTIDGSNESFIWSNGLFHIDTKKYIKISGIRIVNSPGVGVCIKSKSSHIIIEDSYISKTVSSGIWAGISVSRGDAIGDCHHITINANEIKSCNTGMEQEGISLFGVYDFEIKNNYVHNIIYPQEGIDVKKGSSRGSIHHNKVHDNKVNIYVDASDRNIYDVKVYSNLIYGDGEGITLATEKGGSLKDIEIFNNVVYTNGNGFSIHDYMSEPGAGDHSKENIFLINNTFHTSDLCIQVNDKINNFDNLIIRNNILDGSNWRMMSIINLQQSNEITIDHNLFSSLSDVYGENYIISDPKFVDPANGVFHLQSTSPAIDRASFANAPSVDYEGNVRPQKLGVDMGAFENKESTNLPTAPINIVILLR